jgi:hypothetical protein
MNWFNGKQWVAMLIYCFLTFFALPKVFVSIFESNHYADILGMSLGFVISIIIWVGFGKNMAGPLPPF